MSKQLKLPTLLVVTENPSIRFWVKKHLDDQFFIIGADSESSASAACSSRLDFIIVDSAIDAPFAICKTLRKETHLVPILLITGRLKKSYRDKALEAGVTEFLSDQLDPDELKMRIEIGEKTAHAREKTVDLAEAIRPPKMGNESLKNKKILGNSAYKLLEEAKQQNVPISILFLEIDQFSKWENRQEIFNSLGAFIQNLLREKDLLVASTEGRYILLLWNTFFESGAKIAKRLKERIDIHPFSAMRKLSVSIDISSAEAAGKNLEKLLSESIQSINAQKGEK